MLTILRVLDQYSVKGKAPNSTAIGNNIQRGSFKIIYV
jgi:hypothetical protein